MEILDKLWGPHTRNLERALDRTSERHGLLAQNLASAGVPGYRRRDVGFEVELERAASEGGRLDRIRSKLGDRPAKARAVGGPVALEQEVVALGETELRYQMLTDLASRYFSGLRNVIREGR